MYIVVGLCKLGTTFCVNFEQLRCKISVYTTASALRLLENAFHFESEEKKSVDLAWACLSDPRFTDHLLFKTVVFLLHQGVILKAVSTVLRSTPLTPWASPICYIDLYYGKPYFQRHRYVNI